MTPRKKTEDSVFWGWSRAAAVFVIGAVVGFATNYWVSYRSDYRSDLEARLSAFSELNTEVSDHLRTLFEVAEGERQKRPEDVEALRKSLYDSVTEAQTLSARIGNTDTLLAMYQDAAVALQSASQKVTGPLDASPLMEAASDYLVAERQLREAALGSYKSIL